MKRNKLNQQVLQHLQSVETKLVAYRKTQDGELLHQIRLNIKRIKAILFFLKKAHHKKQIPKADNLKPLFMTAGKIRDLQIQISLLNTLPRKPRKLIDTLNNDTLKYSGEFCNTISKYRKTVREFCSDLKLPGSLPEKKGIRIFFESQTDKVSALLKRRGNKKDLHNIRIILKKLLHVYEALPKKSKAWVEINSDFLQNFQKVAGDWHDAYMALNYLSVQKSNSSKTLAVLRPVEKLKYNACKDLLKNFESKITPEKKLEP